MKQRIEIEQLMELTDLLFAVSLSDNSSDAGRR